MFEILEKEELAQGTVVSNTISAPLIARKAKPGQFVIIRVNETGERIPLTMADTDPQNGTITLIYQVVGKSTALMKTLKVGDGYQDICGPLGRATHIEKWGKVICVGGGTGVAVLHPITKGMKEAGNEVVGIIGARTKDLLILEDKMGKASHELRVCTDDGSYGHHGFVTDVLREYLDRKEPIGLIVAIGPVPMMKFTCKLTESYGVKTMVSLNPIMVDGTGMCGCCRVTVAGSTRFACVEGPEFDGHQVNFDELIERQRAYLEQEKESMERFKSAGCQCASSK
ncbi:MAG TPA: sulfide/dihydroorotate dehydrogenase-like FAD/NAD-binding protein [Thermodesulfobacteriota bacterium]|nr:sulfide/dihydroorotate dehydrogenase-like FAD/NAD-binding protein [Thermodesulfobacteriota bacterium]